VDKMNEALLKSAHKYLRLLWAAHTKVFITVAEHDIQILLHAASKDAQDDKALRDCVYQLFLGLNVVFGKSIEAALGQTLMTGGRVEFPEELLSPDCPSSAAKENAAKSTYN